MLAKLPPKVWHRVVLIHRTLRIALLLKILGIQFARINCPSRYQTTCIILTTHMSGLKRTHDWIRDDEKVNYLGLKKSFFPPAAGTLIGNLLKRRTGLRRPTASGLNCDRRTSPWRVLCSHHVCVIWSELRLVNVFLVLVKNFSIT